MTAHTPGPWHYVPGEKISHDAEGWSEWGVTPKIVSLESGEPVVGDAEFIDPRDARLIAAAPDLLEAATLAEDIIDDFLGHLSPDEQIACAEDPKASAALRALRTAIAKSTSQ